jgi:hypothetical protein
MRKRFDRRVVPGAALEFIRGCQQQVACELGGGAALSGAYLGHRLTGDLDLFVHDADDMRALVRALPDIARQTGLHLTLQRDVGHLVRARIEGPEGAMEVDVVHEPVGDIEAPPPPLEGIVVESLKDLRASKLTCILSRSEPRDLVDLYFLDRAGYPPDEDLSLALQKDSGIDPGILAWILSQFPVEPMPQMLEPLTGEDLRRFRGALADRLRAKTVER